jgi:acetolactate synthase small subunit
MAVNLSPVGGVAAQFFTNTGAVLTGGKIYTYLAGTTTPATAYTTSSGAIAWTNPIVLDAAGRVPSGGEIWITDGITYKFVLKDSNDVLIATYDNISGINSNFISFTNQQQIVTATAGQTVFNLSISYQPGTNSLSVFVDGVNQYGPGAQYAYIETDADTVTFVSGLHVGAEVKFTTTQQQGAGVTNASQVTYIPAGASAVATNVQAKLRETVSVKDFGATGDGITNDTAAIQAALNSGANTIYFPAGTYIVTEDGSSYALRPLSNQKIIGAGRGATIIKLANNQGSFSRVFGVLSKTNVTIQSLTVDGNKANQTAGFEQQHGIFINASSNVLVIDVQVKETRGDNIYWYGNCQNCSVVDSWLQTTDRICIHAQIITNCVVSNTHFYVDSGSCGIKCELDGEGLGVDGLTVTGCTFDGATTVSGIIISGLSATTKSSNIAVTGCLFNGLLSVGINIGVYSTNWNISGNVFAGIEEAIIQTSYNVVYGYNGQNNIVISNNTMQGLTGTAAKYAVYVSNCTNLTVTNNSIESATLPIALAATHSTGLHFSNNFISCSNATQGISLYRCQTADINNNTITVKNTGTGVVVENDVTYPSTFVRMNGNTMLGVLTKGIEVANATAGTVYIQNTWAPQATTVLSGYYTTAAPIAGTWNIGDIVYDATPSASGYIGWVCVTAGTPGTWKTFGAISA